LYTASHAGIRIPYSFGGKVGPEHTVVGHPDSPQADMLRVEYLGGVGLHGLVLLGSVLLRVHVLRDQRPARTVARGLLERLGMGLQLVDSKPCLNSNSLFLRW